jgi:hypothetical protein
MGNLGASLGPVLRARRHGLRKTKKKAAERDSHRKKDDQSSESSVDTERIQEQIMYDGQLRNWGWAMFYNQETLCTSLGQVLTSEINKKIHPFMADTQQFLILSSSRRTGNFEVRCECEPLRSAITRARPVVGNIDELCSSSHFYPSYALWDLMKNQNRVPRPDNMGLRFEMKRNFLRYGIPIPSTDGNEENEDFVLLPIGAFDEPNNQFHMTKVGDETYDHMCDWHSKIFLATETIDLMIQAGQNQQDFNSFLSAVIKSLKKLQSRGFPTKFHASFLFNHYIITEIQGLGMPRKNYCQENLIWTVPDLTDFECISYKNWCCTRTDVLRVAYEKCMIPGQEHQLTQDFLRNFTRYYDDLRDDAKMQLLQEDPVNLQKIEMDPRSITDEHEHVFLQIFSNRIYEDAFRRTFPYVPANYYDKALDWADILSRPAKRFDIEIPTVKYTHKVSSHVPELTSRALASDDLIRNYLEVAMRRTFPQTDGVADDPQVDDQGDGEDDDVFAESSDGHDSGPSGGNEHDPSQADHAPRPPHRQRPDAGGGWYDGPGAGGSRKEQILSSLTRDIEIVVLRPNIEHYMLGIIMGLAGENLGNTLWGQTELSVYDDSMHGVWGMSYK